MQGFDGAEEITEERMGSLVRVVLVTTPAIIRKPWLAAPEEELTPFIHELTIYCRNHDIDPSEYVGDWLPLAVTGAGVGAGILARNRAHKKGGGEDEIKKKGFDSTTGFSEPYTPVEKKESEYEEGQGGDSLPEKEQKEEMEIEDDTRRSTETALTCVEAAAPEEPRDRESGI